MNADRFPLDRIVDDAVAPERMLVMKYDIEPAEVLRCSICGVPERDAERLPTNYANPVCGECDELATNEDGVEPWHGWPPGEEPDSKPGTITMAPDDGGNPVYILGVKCWRRYRFGGWITRRDAFDCDTLKEFQQTHRVGGAWIHAFNVPQPDGVGVSRADCDEVHERRDRLRALAKEDRHTETSGAGGMNRMERLLQMIDESPLLDGSTAPDPNSDPEEFTSWVKSAARREIHELTLRSAFCERYFRND